jgi:hypothetical protein
MTHKPEKAVTSSALDVEFQKILFISEQNHCKIILQNHSFTQSSDIDCEVRIVGGFRNHCIIIFLIENFYIMLMRHHLD